MSVDVVVGGKNWEEPCQKGTSKECGRGLISILVIVECVREEVVLRCALSPFRASP